MGNRIGTSEVYMCVRGRGARACARTLIMALPCQDRLNRHERPYSSLCLKKAGDYDASII